MVVDYSLRLSRCAIPELLFSLAHIQHPLSPTRLGTGEELPEVAQALQRQPHEPVNPHACWLRGLFTRIACQALPCLVDAPTRLKTPPKIISLVPDHLFLWRLFRNLQSCGLLATRYVWGRGATFCSCGFSSASAFTNKTESCCGCDPHGASGLMTWARLTCKTPHLRGHMTDFIPTNFQTS